MSYIVNIISYIPLLNRLYLSKIYQENRNDMIKQIDFLNEVNNLKLYKKNFKNIDYVDIPYVYDIFTKNDNRIIVMEQLYGKRLNEIKCDNDKTIYGLLVAKFNMKNILYDRVYHADLHPGNIFFIKTEQHYKIGIIDFGIIGLLTKVEQHNFFCFFKYMLVDNDYIKGSNILLKYFVEPKYLYDNMNKIKKQELCNKLSMVASDIFIKKNNVDAITIYRLNSVLIKYGLSLNRSFCRIELSLAICASVCNELCKKGSNYMHYVNEVTKNMMKQDTLFNL